MPLLTTAVVLPRSPEDVFAFHADVRNLPRLMPPPGARVVRAAVPTVAGDVQEIALGPRRLGVRWQARIEVFDPPRLVVDEQVRGPFRRFRHHHAVLPHDAGTLLVDVVDFRFFPGAIGAALDQLVVKPVLRALFAYRHKRTRALLGRPCFSPSGAVTPYSAHRRMGGA